MGDELGDDPEVRDMNEASEPPEKRPPPRPGDAGDLPGELGLFVEDFGVRDPKRSLALR